MKQESQEFLLSLLEKQKNKELLLKDLCARLPYGVKASTKVGGNITISLIGYDTIIGEDGDSYDISFITPYLFPLSSMTKEQEQELEELGLGYYVTCQDIDDEGYMWDEKIFQMIPCTETDDWINANHFDYRGLIEKGLAIDATGLNIY